MAAGRQPAPARLRAASPLAVYNRKRDFGKTAEPRGGALPRRTGHSFVIQQHDATRMHFDFRLELDGVLKSWAVPKGPSLAVTEKRLAVQTEDHPVSYRDFEGVIPEGEYGGGPVIVWDRGTWEPEGDPREALRKGSLTFRLEGDKLHGRFSLVRLKGKAEGPKSNWLLMKRSDEHVRTGAEAEITARLNRSAISDRTVQEVGAGIAPKGRTKAPKRSPLPALASIEPQLAMLVERPPDDARYVYELKYDGYRMLASVDGREVDVASRNGIDWTAQVPAIVEGLRSLRLKGSILDGELCVVDAKGRTDFQLLQNVLRSDARSRDQKALVFFVFDLLFHQGEDLRGLALKERKERLRGVLPAANRGPVRYSDHLQGEARTLLAQACSMELEGLIGKRADAPYRSGRGRDWIKLKCTRRQEFVVVGMTPPEGSRSGFGSLLLAQWEEGKLRYRGKVGTGFNQKSLADIRKRVVALETSEPPVADPPRLRGVTWARPELVAEVSFTEVTRDGSLRHPSFEGLRQDKPASDVHPERPVKVAKGKAKAGAPEVGGIRISNPDRVMDETAGVTKLQLAQYHEAVADRFLRFAANRPLALVRCPRGDAHQCFFQKHVMPGIGDAVQRIKVRDKETLMVGSGRGVLQLVQFNVMEFHGWGAPFPAYETPDWIIFDLDPDPAVTFETVIESAFEVRDALAALGLVPFVKTTGGKGLHVVVPIEPRLEWDAVKDFCQRIANGLAAHAPDRYVANMSKSQRKGRIFVDYLRNGYGATAILPYSPRARPGITVAMPLDWKELRRIDPKEFSVANVARWIRRRDPWKDFEKQRRSLPAVE